MQFVTMPEYNQMPHTDAHRKPKLFVTSLKVSDFKYFSYQNNALHLHYISAPLPQCTTDKHKFWNSRKMTSHKFFNSVKVKHKVKSCEIPLSYF